MVCRDALVVCAVLGLFSVSSVEAQSRDEDLVMTERVAADALLSGRLTPERDRALGLVSELGPNAGSELRGAVIDAAWAELSGEFGRERWVSEARFVYMDAVANLRDPRAISFLIRVLVNGPFAANALADLGVVAYPAVMEAIEDPPWGPEKDPPWDLDAINVGPAIQMGLVALRFMIEDGSLGPAEVAEVRELVRRLLSTKHYHRIVSGAIELVPLLEDPGLWEIVETLAADREAVEAVASTVLPDGSRNRSHKSNLDAVQEYARRMLAGEEPTPDRHPFWCPRVPPRGVRCPS